MKTDEKQDLYAAAMATGSGVTILLTMCSTFEFFIGSYWLYSLGFTIVLEALILFYAKKYIDKYGLISFCIILFFIPFLAFYTIPQFCHYLRIVPVKKIVLEGTIETSFRRGPNEPQMEIKTLTSKLNKPLKVFNMRKYTFISTTVSEEDYKNLKRNDKVKFKGNLSSVGFDFQGFVK